MKLQKPSGSCSLLRKRSHRPIRLHQVLDSEITLDLDVVVTLLLRATEHTTSAELDSASGLLGSLKSCLDEDRLLGIRRRVRNCVGGARSGL